MRLAAGIIALVVLGATVASAQPSTQLTITKPAQSCSDVPACAERLSDLREYREYLEDTVATCKAVNKDLAAKLRKQAEESKPTEPPEETKPSEPSK